MELIIEEIISAIFDGLLHGKKIPKAVKYVSATLLYGFVIALFVLCALTAADNILFRIFCIVLAVVFTVFYIILLRKIHLNQMNDD